MKGSRTAALASVIAANVGKIDEFLSSNDLPPLSLDPDAPPHQPNSTNFTRARDAALEAISELEALILGPLGILHKASAAVEFPAFVLCCPSFILVVDVTSNVDADASVYSITPRSVYRLSVVSTSQQTFQLMKPRMMKFPELADWIYPICTEYCGMP